MTAQFVQISADKLAELVDDPEDIEELFSGDAPVDAMQRLIHLSEAQRQHIVEQGPEMLENTLARLDPKMREAVSARLGQFGADPSGLAKRAQGEALLKLMMARAGQQAGGQGASSSRIASISIDKSWHGIHYLLCGAAEPTSALISKAILGGTDIGEDFSGYGEARYLTVVETAAMSSELNRKTLEAEMTRRFDPAQMTRLGIYPNGWSGPDGQWLLREFRNLRAFYADAATKGIAMVTCLV
ncbi:MAG TPA: DUF1877 family protein [Candidatus Binataceae bacterium]|nr:DUF1877 family protein [Candidatus Binataceae bacterium]